VGINVAGLQLDPSLNADIAKDTIYTKTDSASLTSIIDSPTVVVWTLEEYAIHKPGNPRDFLGAIVLKPSGADFSAEMEFTAAVGGVRLTAKNEPFMSSRVFRKKNVRDEREREFLERMEASEFSEYLKKVANEWDLY
jgi:hypothetical protein